jgi:hypothetical protein
MTLVMILLSLLMALLALVALLVALLHHCQRLSGLLLSCVFAGATSRIRGLIKLTHEASTPCIICCQITVVQRKIVIAVLAGRAFRQVEHGRGMTALVMNYLSPAEFRIYLFDVGGSHFVVDDGL